MHKTVIFYVVLGTVIGNIIWSIITGAVRRLANRPDQEYRDELCPDCGRLVRWDEPVDLEGRCMDCRYLSKQKEGM